MKVLVVGLATFDEMAGGSARYLSGMVAALRRAGHGVEVVTAAGTVGTRGYNPTGIVGQIRRSIARLVLVQPRAIRAVFRRPDVLNVHFALDGLGAVLAAQAWGVPVVVMFQGPWAQEAVATGRRGSWPLSTRLRRTIEHTVYRSASRCIVLSPAFRDVLHRDYGVPLSRIRVIPAGIDADAFSGTMDRSDARRRLGLADRPTVVTVRRLVRRMGIDLLLEAVARARPAGVLQVAIAGVGPEQDALAAQAAALGIADDVTFLGRVPDGDLEAVYAAGDLCVVPTRELEGFGYVALEAYLAGTPVLAAAVGGLVELVGEFQPGALVTPDAAALAAALAPGGPAWTDDRAACRAYAERFDWSVVLPRVTAVFDEARSGGRGRNTST